MAVTHTQTLGIIRPREGGPQPPGNYGLVWGTATWSAGTIEVKVPFGGDYCWALANILTVVSGSVVPVGTDNVIASNAVTFQVNNTTSSDDITYQVIGRMDEA